MEKVKQYFAVYAEDTLGKKVDLRYYFNNVLADAPGWFKRGRAKDEWCFKAKVNCRASESKVQQTCLLINKHSVRALHRMVLNDMTWDFSEK